MHLSKFTDYSFRVLMHLAVNEKESHTVESIATFLNTSENHLRKIVNRLVNLGYVHSKKGRGGGLKLGKNPSEISLGIVLVQLEENLELVDCMNIEAPCPFMSRECKLRSVIGNALQVFLKEFQSKTLADII